MFSVSLAGAGGFLPDDPQTTCVDPRTGVGDYVCATTGVSIFGPNPSAEPPFNAFSVPSDLQTPKHRYFHLTQRGLFRNNVATVAHVGGRGRALNMYRDINASPLGRPEGDYDVRTSFNVGGVYEVPDLGGGRIGSVWQIATVSPDSVAARSHPTSAAAIDRVRVSVRFAPIPVLLEAVAKALARDADDRRLRARRREVRARYDWLTPRERDVLAHLISGQLNKQMGFDLGISERTIKIHRHRVLEKMEADSVAELVRLSADIGIAPVGTVR